MSSSSSSSAGTYKNVIGDIVDKMKRRREENSVSFEKESSAPTLDPTKAQVKTIFLDLSDASTDHSQAPTKPVLVLRPERWKLVDETPGVVDVRVALQSQSKLNLSLACTAFGMASTWYFLRRATGSSVAPAAAAADRYSIETDTNEINLIIQMTRDIYPVCKRDPTSGYALGEEKLSLDDFPQLANTEWMDRYKDYPIATLPLSRIILPVVYRIARTRYYLVEIGAESRVFFQQDNVDEPELSADDVHTKAVGYLWTLVGDSAAKPAPATARKSAPLIAPTSKAAELQKQLKTYLDLTDDLYARQRPHLAAIRAGDDLDALENAMAFFTGESRDELLRFYYDPLVNALKLIDSPDDKKSKTREEEEVKIVSTTTTGAATDAQKLAAIAQTLLRSGAKPKTRVEIRSEPPSTPLESSRRPSLVTMPSIVEVAAQILYSPYLVNPATGVQYPFSIVISIGENITMSIFKDGYANSPWLLFDSHGATTMTVKLFTTIESLGQYNSFRGSFQTYEVYLHKADRDAIVAAFTQRYADAFGGLEPFRPTDTGETGVF